MTSLGTTARTSAQLKPVRNTVARRCSVGGMLKRKTWGGDLPSIVRKKYPTVMAAQQNVAAPQIFQPVPQHDLAEQETTKSTKQKSKALANWNLNGKSHEYLFGSSNKGQANLRALNSVIVRHHITDSDKGRKTFRYAPICSIHACGDVCSKGKGCPNLHRC